MGHVLGGPEGVQELDAAHGNPLMLFLQSLLPWNVVVPRGAEDPDAPPGEFNMGDYDMEEEDD